MPLPASYTDSSLRQFMHDELLDVASVLGWTAPEHTAYGTALRRALRVYGVEQADSADDAGKLELLATMEIWRSVVYATTTNINWGVDKGRYDESAIHQQARQMLAAVEAAAIGLGYLGTPASDWSSTLITDARW